MTGLDNATLLEQAQTKGQDHLLAISKRKSLDTAITDVLVERGDKPVMLSVANNPGAAFSESGFVGLVPNVPSCTLVRPSPSVSPAGQAMLFALGTQGFAFAGSSSLATPSASASAVDDSSALERLSGMSGCS